MRKVKREDKRKGMEEESGQVRREKKKRREMIGREKKRK